MFKVVCALSVTALLQRTYTWQKFNAKICKTMNNSLDGTMFFEKHWKKKILTVWDYFICFSEEMQHISSPFRTAVFDFKKEKPSEPYLRFTNLINPIAEVSWIWNWNPLNWLSQSIAGFMLNGLDFRKIRIYKVASREHIISLLECLYNEAEAAFWWLY